MSEQDSNANESAPSAQQEFSPMIEMSPAKLRVLIEGLRKLPNVSDLAVINAISELDRIATTFEGFNELRRIMFEQRASSGESLEAVFDSGCDCDNCRAKRALRNPAASADSAKH
jgi:hypothetical protein